MKHALAIVCGVAVCLCPLIAGEWHAIDTISGVTKMGEIAPKR